MAFAFVLIRFKDRQITELLDVTDLVLFRPRVPFCATGSLWGGVTHTLGQTSKHVGSVFRADRAL